METMKTWEKPQLEVLPISGTEAGSGLGPDELGNFGS